MGKKKNVRIGDRSSGEVRSRRLETHTIFSPQSGDLWSSRELTSKGYGEKKEEGGGHAWVRNVQ